MVPHDQQVCVFSGAGFAVIVVKGALVISVYVSHTTRAPTWQRSKPRALKLGEDGRAVV